MKMSIRVLWNDNLCLIAESSATIAHNILTMLAGEFVNAEKAGYYIPPLSDLVYADSDYVFECVADDGTGKLSVFIKAL